ncbi:MAG: radical SAM protein [Planctomycetota bacterium]
MLYSDHYIRPPNEAASAIIRLTRGCPWNRCRFCGIYDAMGTPYRIPPKEEVLEDIRRARHLYGAGARPVFFGDADPIAIAPDNFVEITRAAREAFPLCERITCYGRMATVWKQRRCLARFAEAGLTRIHAGLETGSNDLLRFHKKGIGQARMIAAGRAVVESGLQLSLYVLLGLGGSDRWEEHVAETIKVLNAIRPQFVRFRRLWVHPRCSLAGAAEAGVFTPQTPEGTVIETRDILAGMDFPCQVECMHANNYVNFECRLPEEREEVIREINGFLSRSNEEKERIYSVRSRI